VGAVPNISKFFNYYIYLYCKKILEKEREEKEGKERKEEKKGGGERKRKKESFQTVKCFCK